MDAGQDQQVLVATGHVVSLDREADRVGLSVDDEIRRDEQRLRRMMVYGFVAMILIGDVFAFTALGWFSWLDQTNLEHKFMSAGDRIVNHQVIMALLGATTVQIGAIATIIARYLFPGSARSR